MSAGAIPTFDEFSKKQSGSIPNFDEFSASAPISLRPGGGPGSNPEPVSRFVNNFVSAVNPVPGIKQMATEAMDPRVGLRQTLGTHLVDPQMEQFHQANEALHGRGEAEGMSLPSRLSLGFGHGLAGALPLVGPAAANVGEQIGEGDVAGGLGSGAGLLTTMATPDILRGTGKGLMRSAEPLAENAMGIRNVDRAPSKTPGRAALDMTTGVRPSTVAESAGKAIRDRAVTRDALLARSPATVNIQSAIDELNNAATTGRAGNSDVSHITPMIRQLTEPKPGFQGTTIQPPTPMIANPHAGMSNAPATIPGSTPPPRISTIQSPLDALKMRQRFGEDFTKFDVARPLSNEALRVGNRGYGKLTDEIHSAVPESAPLDRDISNLVPVRDASRARDLNAGPLQRIAGRFGAHTGALAGGLYGASQYGLPGAIAGVAIPEMLADPTTQMIAARSINAGGRALRSPIVNQPARVAPLIREKSKQ